jgi:hypothetical protein
MSLYYDPDGRPIPEEQWVASFGHDRHIGASVVRVRGQWFTVSTVWLGMDHGWGRTKRPIIYETMIFPWREGAGVEDLLMWRYCTAREAMRGHMRAVRWLKRNVREARNPQLIHNGRKPTAVGRPSSNRKK